MTSRGALTLSMLFLIPCLASCGGGTSVQAPPPLPLPSPSPVPATSVVVTPTTITLAPGGTGTFTVTVNGLDNTTVTWTVQELGGGSINDAGVYNAPPTTGFYHVLATSVADPSLSNSATITVTTSTASFTPTGSMQNARGIHSATLLANGIVLVAGGATKADPLCFGGMASAELYDPATDSFTPTKSMAALRYAHTATLLSNGEVLVTGGFGSGYDCEDLGEPAQNSAELYSPSTGAFRAAGSMVEARGGHTATLLPNGKLLIAGGGDQGGSQLPFYGTGIASAELYDPAADVSFATGSMTTPRFGHTATLLANGIVLLVGGVSSYSSNPTATAEIYDPATGAFTLTGTMATPRAGHTATLLQDGRVLISGGLNTGIINGVLGVSSSAEIYDPGKGSFSATGQMGVARDSHTATLLPNGTVLVTGGGSSTAEVYDPSAGTFNTTGGMETQRSAHSATLLPNGKVLVAGGGYHPFLTTAELYK